MRNFVPRGWPPRTRPRLSPRRPKQGSGHTWTKTAVVALMPLSAEDSIRPCRRDAASGAADCAAWAHEGFSRHPRTVMRKARTLLRAEPLASVPLEVSGFSTRRIRLSPNIVDTHTPELVMSHLIVDAPLAAVSTSEQTGSVDPCRHRSGPVVSRGGPHSRRFEIAGP